MIAFCCATYDHDVFRAGAATALQAVIEGDSLLLRRHAPDSRAHACNEMLELAAARTDVEAVVLTAEDVAFERDDLLSAIRSSLDAGGEVAVLGAVPAVEVPGLVASRQPPPPGGRAQVDAVDGTLLALSPWAAGAVRFDPELDLSLDVAAIDVCLQARAHGRRVLAGGLGVVRGAEAEPGQQAEAALRRKWQS